MKRSELAKRMVASELTIGRTDAEIAQFTRQAAEYGVLAVCVHQNMVRTALAAADNRLHVFTVAGFPSGIDLPITKVSDVELSARNGAKEIDMGVNLSAWKSNDRATLLEELQGGVQAAHQYGSRFSAVLNTYQLEDADVQSLSALCAECGVDTVKTTSGDSVIPRATVPHDVQLIRNAVGCNVAIKAEGQIDTLEAALDILEAGADVVCSHNAFAILDPLD